MGVFLRLFTKKKKYNYYGEVLIGFGLLFLGLATMKDGFAPLRSSEEFRNAFILFSSTPILAVAAGAILTMIVQSSSATIGITIALASTGLIDFYGASALVLGENIGTTLTANIAAIGTNSAARRAALGHMIFNVIGVAYMLILLKPFVGFIDSITPGSANMVNAAGQNPYIARHIANLHTMFNIINTIIFLPILGTLASLCKWLIKEDEDEQEQRLKFIDDRLIDTPELAVTQAQKEVQRMSDIALDMLKTSKEAFFQRDHKLIDKIYRKEDVVDLLEKDITDFLVKLFQKSVSEKNSEVINNIFHVLHDIEKIADHAENIAKFTERIIDNKISFSEKALDEMNEIFDVTIRFSSNVLNEYNKGDLPKDIDTRDEDLIDKYKRKFKNNHMKRFNEGKCNVDAGIVYVDILNNLEKAGDHSFNIAQVVQGSE